MRITVLSGAAGTVLGGQEVAAVEFGAALAALGHEVALVTGRALGGRAPLGSAAHDVITVPFLPRGSRITGLAASAARTPRSVLESRVFWGSLRRSREAVRRLETSDVVVAFHEVEAVAASRTLDVPVVYYYPGPMSVARLRRGRLAALVAVSEVVAERHARGAPGLGLRPVDAVIPPGVPEGWIADGPAPGTAADVPETVLVGRLDSPEEKGLDVLVECWPRVLAAVPTARLTVYGAGAGRPRLARLLAKAEAGRAIRLGGEVRRDRLRERLRSAGLFMLPSPHESFGTAAVEALAVGLPVIASDTAGLRESVGDAGLLVPAGDASAFADAAIRILSDRDARRDLAARGPARVRGWTWAARAVALERQLVATVGSARSSGA